MNNLFYIIYLYSSSAYILQNTRIFNLLSSRFCLVQGNRHFTRKARKKATLYPDILCNLWSYSSVWQGVNCFFFLRQKKKKIKQENVLAVNWASKIPLMHSTILTNLLKHKHSSFFNHHLINSRDLLLKEKKRRKVIMEEALACHLHYLASHDSWDCRVCTYANTLREEVTDITLFPFLFTLLLKMEFQEKFLICTATWRTRQACWNNRECGPVYLFN